MRVLRLFAIAACSTLLAACFAPRTGVVTPPPAQGDRADPYVLQQDRAPQSHRDLSDIRNPTPVAEPLARYGNHSPYTVLGKTYQVDFSARDYDVTGIASWYGEKFHGHRTSSFELYDMWALTAAHKTLPLPSYVEVTNLQNGKSVVVKVNDRGPFHDDRIIDLSYAAAHKLGYQQQGTAPVRVKVLALPRQANATVEDPTVWLQLGAWSDPALLADYHKRITASGVVPREFPLQETRDTKDGRVLHKLRIGPLPASEAQLLKEELARQGVNATRVFINSESHVTATGD